MSKSTFAALTIAWLMTLPAAAQSPAADKPPHYEVDAFGLCIFPRDFSKIPTTSQAKVKDFWDKVASAHRRVQRQIIEDYQIELRRKSLDQLNGLSEAEIAIRKSIIADAGKRLAKDRAAYKQEREILISSLPSADREAALTAFAGVVEPITPSCPKGFEADYLG